MICHKFLRVEGRGFCEVMPEIENIGCDGDEKRCPRVEEVLKRQVEKETKFLDLALTQHYNYLMRLFDEWEEEIKKEKERNKKIE